MIVAMQMETVIFQLVVSVQGCRMLPTDDDHVLTDEELIGEGSK